MDWGRIIGAVGGIVANMNAKKDQGDITAAYSAGLQALQNLVPPNIQDLAVKLQDYVLQGQITPEEYTAYLQEQSELQGVKIPDDILNAQHEVLNKLDDIVNSGGLTATDRAKINDINQQVLTTARGNAQRTQQEFAQRGMSGSGMELASRLANDSAATQAASKQGFDVAALAEQRALDALTQYGSQANTMRGQEYTQQSDLAKANDAINQFNTKAKQSTADANIEATNAAQATNLAAKQAIADKNTGVANTEETGRANAVRQNYQNQLNKATAMTGAGTTAGNALTAATGRNVASTTETANTVGDIFNDYMNKKKKSTTDVTASVEPDYSNYDFGSTDYSVSDERVKDNIKDLSDDEIDDILNAITGKKFNYAKNFRNDGKTHYGVMAQDVEKTPIGATIVVEKNGVKGIDNGEAAMLALASLSNLHKRVKKMEGK